VSKIGLSDVRKLIKLMCLTAAGRVDSPDDEISDEKRFYHPAGNPFSSNRFTNMPYDINTCTKLQHIGKAVEVLASTDSSAAKATLEMCTRVSFLKMYFSFAASPNFTLLALAKIYLFLKELLSAAVGFIKLNAPNEGGQLNMQPNLIVTMSLVNLLCGHPSIALLGKSDYSMLTNILENGRTRL